MYQRLTFILLILLYTTFSIVRGVPTCPIPTIGCSQINGICGAKRCVIGSPMTWDNITVSPYLEFTQSSGSYPMAVVTQSANYTFTFTQALNNCFKEVTIEVIVPTFTVIPPKCIRGTFSVVASPASYYNLTTDQFTVAGSPWVANTTFSSIYTDELAQMSIKRYSPTSGYTYCYGNLQVKPVNPLVPIFKYVLPTCKQSTGKVIVTNYQQFSNLTLVMNSPILPLNSQSTNISAVNGVFSGLSVNSNYQQYTLYATAPSCDTEMAIPVTLYSVNPVVSVKPTPISTTTCNSSQIYLTFNVEGISPLGSPNVTVNGVDYQIGVPHLMDNSQYTIIYSGDTCDVSISYEPNLEVQPVSFTSSPALPTCTANATVTLYSPNNDYNSLTFDSSINGVQVNVSMNANHQIQRSYNQSITVYGSCGQLTIPAVTPIQPVAYTTSDNSADCGANFTVIIENYDLFDVLELHGINTGQVYKQPVQGKFLHIWVDRYTIVYRQVGCYLNNSDVVIGYNPSPYLTNAYLYYDVQYEVPKTLCNQTYTTLKVTPIYKGIVGVTAPLFNVTSVSSTYQTVPFINPRCPNAYDQLFYLVPYKGLNPPVFTLAQAPKCASSWPLVKVNTSSTYTQVQTGFGTFEKSSDDTYPVDPTNSYITIFYEDCEPITYYVNNINGFNTPPTQPNLDVEYTVTPQGNEDCNTQSGSIKINSAQYFSATLNGQNATNGEWTGLGYGAYSIVYNHQVCGYGRAKLLVETSTADLTITPTIVKPSTCLKYNEGDAILYFTITRSNGEQVNYTNVVGPGSVDDLLFASVGTDYNPRNTICTSVPGGVRDFYIQSGQYCNFKKTVNVPVKVADHAFKLTIEQYPVNSIQSGVVNIDPLYDGLDIYNIDNDNGFVTVDNKKIIGLDYSSDDGLYMVRIRYNNYCYDYLYINTTNPQPYYPQFTVTPVNQCGSTLVNVQVEQETLDRFYIFIPGYGQVTSTAAFTLSGLERIEFDYQDKQSLETGDTIYYIDSPLETYQINPKLTTTNESCRGASDGTLTITGIDFTKNVVSVIQYTSELYLPSQIIGSSMVFSGLYADSYTLVIESPTNPFCDYRQDFEINTIWQPTFSLEQSPVCIDPQTNLVTSNGTLTVTADSPKFQLSVSVDGVLIQGNTFSSNLGGRYIMISANATLGQCHYTWSELEMLSSDQNSLIVVSTDKCEHISASANGDYIQIYNSQNQMVFDTTDYTYQDAHEFNLAAGVYVVSSKGNCYTPVTVTVQSCGGSTGGNVNSSSTLSPSSFLFIILFISTFISYLLI